MHQHQSTNLIAGKNNKSLAAITFLLSTANAESSTNVRKQDQALLDMSQVGSRMSSLSLNMLNKKDQDEVEQPSDTIMMQKEDLADSDIMAYTENKLADTDDNGDELAFGAGGAIMQALEQQDPSLSQKKSKTNTKKQSKPKSAPKPKQEKKQPVKVEEPKQEVPQSIVQESVPSQPDEVQKQITAEQSKNQFMDNILETTITNKQTKRTQGRQLNSYEKQQAEDNAVWSQIAKNGLSMDEEKPQTQSVAESTKPEDQATDEKAEDTQAAQPAQDQETAPAVEEVKPSPPVEKVEVKKPKIDSKKIKPIAKKKIEIKKKVEIKPVAKKKITAEAIKPKEMPTPIQGAMEIDSQTQSLITPSKILGAQDLSQKSTASLLTEATNALTPEQIQQATDEANAIKAQEQIQKMKDAPPEVVKEEKPTISLPTVADLPQPPTYNVAEEEKAAPPKEMTDQEFKAKAEQAEQRHLEKVKNMMRATQSVGGSVSVSSIISQMDNVKHVNEYADSLDLQAKEDIHLEKKVQKKKKIQIKPKLVQKTANKTSNVSIKSKLIQAQKTNKTTLVLKAKNVTLSKNMSSNHSFSTNTTSNQSLNSTNNVTANKTQNVTLNLVQKNESLNATKNVSAKLNVTKNSSSNSSLNKTETLHKKRAATQTMKLSLVHVDINKNGTVNKTVHAKSVANDSESLNKTSLPNCSLEKVKAHDQLERQAAKQEAIKMNATGTTKYKDLNINTTKTMVQKNETIKANVTANSTANTTVNATSNASANTTVAKNVSKNATKKVVVKKKPLTVDEQIDQVYEELHAGEGEKSPEGFIGKYQKKLSDKKRAAEAAKLAAQYDEETTKNAYMAAGSTQSNSLKQKLLKPKKRGIMARIEERAQAEELEDNMENEQMVAAAMSDPSYQAKIMELTQKKAVLQNARVEAAVKSEPSQAEKTQALAEALLSEGQ